MVLNVIMNEIVNYDEAVNVIKLAILRSQYDAAKTVNEKQLELYFAIGKYISLNSRKGFWGKGAIDTEYLCCFSGICLQIITANQ